MTSAAPLTPPEDALDRTLETGLQALLDACRVCRGWPAKGDDFGWPILQKASTSALMRLNVGARYTPFNAPFGAKPMGDVVVTNLPVAFGCPVELSLTLLGGKWKAVILARLKDRPLRYGELRRLIPRLSDKVLTERLADLQGLGLIAPNDGRPRNGYRLSARGESLRPVLQALYDWGEAQAYELKVVVKPSPP
jgi:DNA-binding HxlR family transcriptional regulator